MTTQSTARPPLQRVRTALAVVGAAALLVAGADAVSYAATGDSLLLGKANKTTRTTTVQNTGSGPALTLRTRKNAPPLAVSSTKLVKKLNADSLDGLSAEAVAPLVSRGTIMAPGQTFAAAGLRSFTMPAGTYRVTLFGAITTETATDTWLCLVADYQKLTANDPTAYLAVTTGEGNDALSATDVVTIRGGRALIAACDGPATAKSQLPVTLTLEKLRGVKTLPTQPFTPKKGAKAAIEHLAGR